jgi:hypothetical protein
VELEDRVALLSHEHVLVVPVILAGMVVPCGGFMLRSVRHGRGVDALLKNVFQPEVILLLPNAFCCSAEVEGVKRPIHSQ